MGHDAISTSAQAEGYIAWSDNWGLRFAKYIRLNSFSCTRIELEVIQTVDMVELKLVVDKPFQNIENLIVTGLSRGIPYMECHVMSRDILFLETVYPPQSTSLTISIYWDMTCTS